MTHGISFVSDLHLFARRSDAPRYAEAIRTAARRSAVLVLGGDIFDFSWSTLPTLEDTVEAAFHWLQHLAAEHPQCQIHYLLGNHDYCQPFLDYLERHAAPHPEFCLAPLLPPPGAEYVSPRRRRREAGDDPRETLEVSFPLVNRPLAGKFKRGVYEVVHRARLHQPWPSSSIASGMSPGGS